MNTPTNLSLIGILLGGLAACGGSDSGVDSGKTLASLSVSEQITLCEWANDQAPTEPYMCNGQTIEPEPAEDCAADVAENPVPATCTATVGDFEACTEAIEADRCTDSIPPACAKLLSCFG